MKFYQILTILLVSAISFFCKGSANRNLELLNVSYDVTREFYQELNPLFVQKWKEKTGQQITISQSHGGSGKQARSIIDGLDADVATLGLGYDIDNIADRGFIDKNWQSRLPNNSAPYTSTIVFTVRKGNPKGIKDWDDLTKAGVEIVATNPKTSGAARWIYLAAWGYATKKKNLNETDAKDFVKSIYKNVKVLDTGGRASTNTFIQKNIGDVLLGWENEAYLSLKNNASNLEVVTPSFSILAEPVVSVVDKYTTKHNNKELATEYLKFLFAEEVQNIAAKHYFRPSNKEILDKSTIFTKLELFRLNDIDADWKTAQKKHFSDGGIFDEIYGIK